MTMSTTNETPRIRQYREYAAHLRAEIARKEGNAACVQQLADYRRELADTESHLQWLLQEEQAGYEIPAAEMVEAIPEGWQHL
jgi:hypothetical protein